MESLLKRKQPRKSRGCLAKTALRGSRFEGLTGRLRTRSQRTFILVLSRAFRKETRHETHKPRRLSRQRPPIYPLSVRPLGNGAPSQPALAGITRLAERKGGRRLYSGVLPPVHGGNRRPEYPSERRLRACYKGARRRARASRHDPSSKQQPRILSISQPRSIVMRNTTSAFEADIELLADEIRGEFSAGLSRVLLPRFSNQSYSPCRSVRGAIERQADPRLPSRKSHPPKQT